MAEEVKAPETQVAEVKQETHVNRVADASLGVYGSSDNLTLAYQMSQRFASSDLVPQQYRNKPDNCLVAIEMANRMNMSPFYVMQKMDVIQGRPSWSASALIGMINASGKYDHDLCFEETKDKNGKPYSCTAWTTRKGVRVDGIEITMDMAQAEGWLNKNGSKWKTMPQVMLRYRAASFFSRLNCPEITMGLYTTEEVVDSNFTPYNTEMSMAQAEATIEENANSVVLDMDDIEVVEA